MPPDWDDTKTPWSPMVIWRSVDCIIWPGIFGLFISLVVFCPFCTAMSFSLYFTSSMPDADIRIDWPACKFIFVSECRLKSPWVLMLIPPMPEYKLIPALVISMYAVPEPLAMYTTPAVSCISNWCPDAVRSLVSWLVPSNAPSSMTKLCPGALSGLTSAPSGPMFFLRLSGRTLPGVLMPNTWLGDSLLAELDVVPLIGSATSPWVMS